MIYTGYRLYKALIISSKYAKKVFSKAIHSKETSTFTYNLTPENELYLMNLAAQVTRTSIQEIERYFNELKENQQLKEDVLRNIGKSAYGKKKDKNRCDYGSKLALYSIIRALKPEIVVENGVEVGFTSIVLCEALRKNIEEGYKARFYGLDISENAGYLITVSTKYKDFAEMKYDDAIKSLGTLEKIDFYFSDGLRTYQYEKEEFACLRQKLKDNSVVITNKATFSKALFELASNLNRKYVFFKEQPLNHWYDGSGIGILYS